VGGDGHTHHMPFLNASSAQSANPKSSLVTAIPTTFAVVAVPAPLMAMVGPFRHLDSKPTLTENQFPFKYHL